MRKESAKDAQPAALSFCAAEPTALEQWSAELPLVNTAETARLIAIATEELAEVRMTPLRRLELLDVIRPTLRYICTRINRASTTKTTLTDDTSPHQLQRNLCRAYGAAFEQTLVALEAEKPANKDLLARIGHRVITELSLTILQCMQHYLEVPTNFWQQLNTTFAELERRDLGDYKLKDDEVANQGLTVREAYLRTLLLQTCNYNKLNQNELNHLYNALEEWSGHASLSTDLEGSVYAIDLASNLGPVQAERAEQTGTWLGLRTEVLTYELEAYMKEVSTNVVVPDTVDNELIQHAILAWSSVHPRAFRRIPTESQIRVCIGLRAVHFFLSGGIEFNEQITNTDTFLRREVNPFLDVAFESAGSSVEDDPWGRAHDLKVPIPENPNIEEPSRILFESQKPARTETKYSHHELRALDTSPKGYRLRWPEAMAREAQVGEIIALREEVDERWCVAVIRWISQSGSFAEMGVELLAPKAIPIAIRSIRKISGTTEFQRGLLLPSLEAIDQPATIITPNIQFVERQKVSIQRQGLQTTGMLMSLVEKAQSFNQFTFRVLDGY